MDIPVYVNRKVSPPSFFPPISDISSRIYHRESGQCSQTRQLGIRAINRRQHLPPVAVFCHDGQEVWRFLPRPGDRRCPNLPEGWRGYLHVQILFSAPFGKWRGNVSVLLSLSEDEVGDLNTCMMESERGKESAWELKEHDYTIHT